MSLRLSTAYLPPISYIAACCGSGNIRIEICETYCKQTCRNRCYIAGPNGKQTLSVPVIKPQGNHTMTRDVRIDYNLPWQKIHWRSIEAAYSQSPFFLYYQDYFIPSFETHYDFLIDLNNQLLETIFLAIRLDKPFGMTEVYEKSPPDVIDNRVALSAKYQRFEHPEYVQVFSERHGFIPNLSIIDLVFNLGPQTIPYLDSLN